MKIPKIYYQTNYSLSTSTKHSKMKSKERSEKQENMISLTKNIKYKIKNNILLKNGESCIKGVIKSFNGKPLSINLNNFLTV